MHEAPATGRWQGLRSRAGDDVLSHPVSRAVPSARRGLTTVFGMGTGVALAPWPPAICVQVGCAYAVMECAVPSTDLSRWAMYGLAKPLGRLVRLG